MKFGVVLFSRMSVPISAVLSTKQSSQGDHEKSGGCEFPISGGCEFPRRNQGGVSFQSQGVVVFEEESGGCSTFFFTAVFLGPNAQAKAPLGTNTFTPFTPSITTCESCFPLKLAKLGTLILEKRTTPDFKNFSQEKKEMKKQNEKNKMKNFLKFGVVLFSPERGCCEMSFSSEIQQKNKFCQNSVFVFFFADLDSPNHLVGQRFPQRQNSHICKLCQIHTDKRATS